MFSVIIRSSLRILGLISTTAQNKLISTMQSIYTSCQIVLCLYSVSFSPALLFFTRSTSFPSQTRLLESDVGATMGETIESGDDGRPENVSARKIIDEITNSWSNALEDNYFISVRIIAVSATPPIALIPLYT